MIFEMILALSVFGIGIMMFPILKKYIENLAIGYAIIRLVETIFIIVSSLSVLVLLNVSHEYVSGSLDVSYYQPLGILLLSLRDWSLVIGTLIFLGLGGLILNYLLYISKLIPRFRIIS